MKKLLIVVDYQKDFVDGALGFPGAEKLAGPIQERIETYRKNGDEVLFTFDTHPENYMETQEGKNLPVPHCIEGSAGWELYPPLKVMEGEKVFCKKTFGSSELMDYLRENTYEQIELAGLVSSICVISNALLLKATVPETPIIVDASCCAGVTPASHKNALEAMKMCQITIENEA